MIVLASASPRRAELMDFLGVEFTVAVAHVDESFTDDVSEIAHAKWRAVAQRREAHEVVIACDTLVFAARQAFGKPRDREHARAMITDLAGSEIAVRSGLAIGRPSDGAQLTTVETAVTIRAMSAGEIERYVQSGVGDDKAAALALQDTEAGLAAEVRGCWSNIVGLPVCVVASLIRRPLGDDQRFSQCSPRCPSAGIS